MGCSFRGWGVCLRDGVLFIIREGVLVYGLGVSKRDVVLVSCFKDGVLVYRMGCY